MKPRLVPISALSTCSKAAAWDHQFDPAASFGATRLPRRINRGIAYCELKRPHHGQPRRLLTRPARSRRLQPRWGGAANDGFRRPRVEEVRDVGGSV